MDLPKLRGFTLIELLVAVSIIGLLLSVASVSYSEVQKRARNQRRQADLHIIAIALERFYSDHGFYPSTTSGGGNLAWESGGRSDGDHLRCLLGGVQSSGFIKGTKDQDCGFIKPPFTGNPPSTNYQPANVYLGRGNVADIPKDPSNHLISGVEVNHFAYASDGQSYALATVFYEGLAPVEHRFTSSVDAKWWNAGSPWDVELKQCQSGVGQPCNYILLSPGR